MARKKNVPVKDAKTIPQKIARQELVTGKKTSVGALGAPAGTAVIRNPPPGMTKIPVDMLKREIGLGIKRGNVTVRKKVQPGKTMLARNVRGDAPTRRGDVSAGAKDKRTVDFKRQQKSKIDVKDAKDREFLKKKERERERGTKASKAKVGAKVKFMYYKKEREGKIVDIKMKKGVPRQMSVDVVGMGRINTDVKNII